MLVTIRRIVSTGVDIVALGMVSVGGYLIYEPVGYIVGGFSCLALNWALGVQEKKEGGE
jgi:hypothetical protein